ncbi:early nodulin-75-like [Salvia divinorum]|uniref:Early nodulin-75-like n=1 Tax=Salvia divinorum TaxID=28513 RepID=A0ABD1HGD5_SALDI
MSFLLLIFFCSLVINSQARTLTENRDHKLGGISRKQPLHYNGPAVPNPGKQNYGRDEHELAPPTHQVSDGGASVEEKELWKLKIYGRDKPKRAPPAPKEAPPTHQVSGGRVVALGNFGKEGGEVVPPPPHHAPPTHQVTGGGVVAQENYGKEGSHLAPPPPHHAPPTHQVSGGGEAEMEESWAAYVLLSASA